MKDRKKISEEAKQEAINLFFMEWNDTPENLGYPCIDIYRCQRAFLYGKTQEAVEAYKLNQNVIRGLIPSSVSLSVMSMILEIFLIFKSVDGSVSRFAIYIPLMILGMILIICICGYFIARNAERKCKNKVIWLNYEN